MGRFAWCMLLALALASCAGPTLQGPFRVDKPYGGPAPYGEFVHPGIDYAVKTGAPVIAVADGTVDYVATPDGPENGLFVRVSHEAAFKSLYGHLDTVFVRKGDHLKRGDFVGWSGESNGWGKPHYQHLHFGICKPGQNCQLYSQTLDPGKFWLGGEPQCFEPGAEYPPDARQAITLPLACGDQARDLRKPGREGQN